MAAKQPETEVNHASGAGDRRTDRPESPTDPNKRGCSGSRPGSPAATFRKFFRMGDRRETDEAVSAKPRLNPLACDDMSIVMRSAESVCVGVSSRVSASDFLAIVTATLTTYGVTERPVKVNPPPSLVDELLSHQRERATATVTKPPSRKLATDNRSQSQKSADSGKSKSGDKPAKKEGKRPKKDKEKDPKVPKTSKSTKDQKKNERKAKTSDPKNEDEKTPKLPLRGAIISKIMRTLESQIDSNDGEQVTVGKAFGFTREHIEKHINNMTDDEYSAMLNRTGSYLERSGLLQDESMTWADRTYADLYLNKLRVNAESIKRKTDLSKNQKKIRESSFTIQYGSHIELGDLPDILKSKEGHPLTQLIVGGGGIAKRYMADCQARLCKVSNRGAVANTGFQKVKVSFADNKNLSPPVSQTNNVSSSGVSTFYLGGKLTADRKEVVLCIALTSEAVIGHSGYLSVLKPTSRVAPPDDGLATDGESVEDDSDVRGEDTSGVPEPSVEEPEFDDIIVDSRSDPP